MEIPPVKADIAQIFAGQGGAMIQIDNDVQNVANDLAEIDPHLRLRYSEKGEYFVVYWKPDHEDEGSGDLVTTAQELDQRIVTEVRRIYQQNMEPGFSFAAELEKVEQAGKREADRERMEHNGEMYERLAHAMRKDKGLKNRIVVPGA